MMSLVETIANLDKSLDLHAARLLILINAFTNTGGESTVQGLTKLAKLDFLLRYPVMLERALIVKGRSTRDVGLEDYERQNVESEMVRYRFGPWDHKYRTLLNYLVAKGLVTINVEGRTVVIALTDAGSDCAHALTADDSFEQYTRRSKILKTHFDLTATNLMKFIYDTFPEIISLRSGASIPT